MMFSGSVCISSAPAWEYKFRTGKFDHCVHVSLRCPGCKYFTVNVLKELMAKPDFAGMVDLKVGSAVLN